ncbi:plasmid pRiA4b ORF-3 family protein [Amycolatopsis sp. NPDC004378]
MKTTRIQVRLREVQPTVLRVIDIPTCSTLPELHDLLQASLGWTDSHLHQFVTDQATYGVPDDGWDEQDTQHDETSIRLRDLPARFEYLYDFGDGWTHDIEILGSGGVQPGCVYGEGPCPPEDCGGPDGYAHLREVLADPHHDDHDELRSWAGELPDFDHAATDLAIQQTAGSVPDSVRLLLELATPGVTLTPGGRLPRAFVRDVQQHRPHWHPNLNASPAAREDNLVPLVALHDLLRRAGLLRLAHGVLAPTRAAKDDREIVRRLRSAFPPGEFTTVLSGVTLAVLTTQGPRRLAELAAQVHPLLGHGWASADGAPLTEIDVQLTISRLGADLRGLDLINVHAGAWRAGSSACTLLPNATALARVWSAARAAPES